MRSIALNTASTWSVAARLRVKCGVLAAIATPRAGTVLSCPGDHFERDQPVVLVLGGHGLVRNERVQVLVENLPLLVGELLEPGERVVQRFIGAEIDAELGQLRLERIAARQLAQRELVRVPAHVLRAHDLVGFAVLEHAVLVNAGLVRERIRADDRFVRLHREAGDAGDELRRREDLRGVDPRRALETRPCAFTAITISSS